VAWISRAQRADGSTAFRVRYRGPDGKGRTRTFHSEADAKRHAATSEADLARGDLLDPRAAQITVADYGAWFLTVRPLTPSTAALYRGLQRNHINPTLGTVPLGKVTPEMVRQWWADTLARTGSRNLTAKAYRHLSAIFAQAVDDERIRRNPCRIRGGGTEPPSPRPDLTIADAYALADAVPERWRAMVLTAAFGGLRLGELRGLCRRDINFLHSRLTVARQAIEVDGALSFTIPKTAAGLRTFTVPPVLRDLLAEHCDTWVAPDADALIFTGIKGGPLRKCVWQRAWGEARTAVGRPDVHLHDLRRLAEQLNAEAGATVREMMARMGQNSPTVAVRYLHLTASRDRTIADNLGTLIAEARS